jgi:rhamnose transport system permease protein
MTVLRNILLRREAGILVMIVLFCLAVGLYKPQFLTLDQPAHHPAAHAADHDRRHGPDAGPRRPPCRPLDRLHGRLLRHGEGMMFRFIAEIPWWPRLPRRHRRRRLLGLVNGALVTMFKLPAIIVTLGTLNLYRGLTFIISNARQIDRQFMPSELKAMSQTSPIFGIPWIIFIAFGVALLTYWFVMHTRVGRQIFALGSNPSRRRCAASSDQVTLLVFTISGALAGLAGILYASRWGFVNPSNTGAGFEFQVIAAVVIGGVSINGGVGTVLGRVLGVLLLGCVSRRPAAARHSGHGAERDLRRRDPHRAAHRPDRAPARHRRLSEGRGHERAENHDPPRARCRAAAPALAHDPDPAGDDDAGPAGPRRVRWPACSRPSSSTSTTSSEASRSRRNSPSSRWS